MTSETFLVHFSIPSVSNIVVNLQNSFNMTSKIIRKTLEEAQHVQNAEIDFSDKNLIHLEEMPRLWTMKNVTRLTLSHNKITEIPAALVSGPS